MSRCAKVRQFNIDYWHIETFKVRAQALSGVSVKSTVLKGFWLLKSKSRKNAIFLKSFLIWVTFLNGVAPWRGARAQMCFTTDTESLPGQ